MHFTLRRAIASDADEIANVYWASFRLLTFLPMLHTIEENRWFIANVILKEYEVTVAEDGCGRRNRDRCLSSVAWRGDPPPIYSP